MTHPCFLSIEELLKQCSQKNYKDSGPGGQHRNKIETGVELCHTATGISVRASERRQQTENMRMATKRLRLKLALELRSEWQQPSTLWAERCQGAKIVCSDKHEDFSRLLSEALDVLEKTNHDVKECSLLLGVSLSQLIKFLKKAPLALKQLNDKRKEKELKPLK